MLVYKHTGTEQLSKCLADGGSKFTAVGVKDHRSPRWGGQNDPHGDGLELEMSV